MPSNPNPTPKRELTLFDKPENQARVRRYFYVALVILMGAELLIPKHGHFPWEAAYGFYAVYGFMGCVALIFIAKGLRWLVRRREDYYD
jgi:membrane protease YdiL (CAAX protease family)